jgi:hypothetical protein
MGSCLDREDTIWNLERRGYYVVHRNAQMAFVIDAFSIADKQDLGGFVVDLEGIGYSIGYRAVVDQIKIIEIDSLWCFTSFEPALYQGAGGATGTMLKDQLRAGGRSFPDLFQLFR